MQEKYIDAPEEEATQLSILRIANNLHLLALSDQRTTRLIFADSNRSVIFHSCSCKHKSGLQSFHHGGYHFKQYVAVYDFSNKRIYCFLLYVADMAPFYQHICSAFNWPLDSAFLESMQQANATGMKAKLS
jgi:hypothetical protein